MRGGRRRGGRGRRRRDLFLSRSVFVLGVDKPNCSMIVSIREEKGELIK